MNWKVIAYFILSIGIVAYGTNMLLSSGPVRAILFAIGTTLLLIFFGFRWFSSNSSSSTPSWPPTINTCPDYLTYVPAGTAGVAKTILSTSFPSGKGTNGGCVDSVGMSTNGTLTVTDIPTTTQLSYTTTTVFPYTSADVSSSTLSTICRACSTAGITWEGVWDGDTCIGAAAIAAAAAGNCPSI